VPDAVRVGLLMPLSGEGEWVGTSCVHAARAALELARERGRLGPEVDLVPFDARHPRGDAYDPALIGAEAERVIGELAARGCDVLMGTISSAQAARTIPLAAARNAFYWEAIAAADGLTAPDRPYVFRLDTTARTYGAAVADFIASRLAPAWEADPAALRLAIARMEEPFCAAVAAGVRDAAAALGIRTVAEATFPVSGADLAAATGTLRDARPDVVFMTAFGANVPEFWRAARAQRLEPRALVGNGAWALDHRVRELGSDLEGIFLVDTPHVSSMGTQGLGADAREQLEWWKAHCGEPHSTKTAVDRDLVFIATYVLAAELLPRAAGRTAEALRAAARAVDIPLGGTILGYGVRFDPRGDNERAFAAIFQWQDGRRHIVDPAVVATAAPRLAPLPRWAERPVPA